MSRPYDSDWAKQELYSVWPELKKFDDFIYLIYAANNPDHPFWKRTVEDLCDEITLNYNSGKTRFLFECFSETVITEHLLKIHNTITKVKEFVPLAKFYLISGSPQAELAYKQFCERLQVEPLIDILACYHQEFLYSRKYTYDKMYTPGPKSKKFLCFNRMYRQHRIDLLEEIIKYDLLKESYYSFTLPEHKLLDLEKYYSSVEPHPYQNVISLKDSFPLILNLTEDRPMFGLDIIEDDLKYFENSYFSIITETVFYDMLSKQSTFYSLLLDSEHCVFPTEKTYKAIGMKHPFIVVSTDGFLKEIRKQGYKTFSPYIDESYDTIVDDKARLAAIVNEVKRLSSMSEEELIELTHCFKDIVEHNYDVFKNQTDFRATKNVETLF
jgi:hypothetical protein